MKPLGGFPIGFDVYSTVLGSSANPFSFIRLIIRSNSIG